ncbi:MAG: hypothetical protein KAG99_07910, partial [Bacteroidales bacterium]|nr:hypothetical protein [Bacteroidales bacterium]
VVDIPSTYKQVIFDGQDIVYDSVLDIGFTFKFYEYTVSKFVIAPNGWISFDTLRAGTFDYWQIDSIPNISDSVPKNAILAPWQDWKPILNSVSYVGYETIGDPPDRQLVVSWFNVSLSPHEDSLGIFQIILNEYDKTIENHITKKPGTHSQGNIATQGVHNHNGTLAVTVPNRNKEPWTTSYDAWRYLPSGSPQFYDIESIPHNPIISGVLSDVFWYKNAYDPDSFLVTGNALSITPAQTTSYLAVVLLNDIVPYIDTITITVIPLPIANAGNDTVINASTFALLEGTHLGGLGDVSYHWEPAAFVVDPEMQNTTSIPLTQPKVFNLSVEDEYGCKSDTKDNLSEKVVAILFGDLFVNLNVDRNKVCANDTITLEASAFGGNFNPPGYTYFWWAAPGGTIIGTSDSIVQAIPQETTMYYVRVKDADENTKVDSIHVFVPEIDPEINGDTSVCELGTNIYLTDSTGNFFSWNLIGLDSIGSSINNNIFTINWNEVDTGIIQVIETYEDEQLTCRDTAYLQVTVYPNPQPSIYSLDDSVCEGTDAVYSPTNITENEYEWDFSPSTIGTSNNYDTTIFNVDWIGAGTAYVSLTETSEVGCTSSDLFVVVINPLPEPLISGGLDACEDDTLLYITDFIIGNEYEWELYPPAIGEIITSPDSNEIAIYWENSGTASLYVTETVTTTSCGKISDTITISVNPSPVFSAFPGNDAICFGDSTMVTLTGTDLYTWIPDTGLIAINDSAWLLKPSTTTTYKITGKNAGSGCADSIFYSIEVKPNPVVDLGDDRYLWNDASLFLNAGDGFDYYFWSTGDVDSVLQVFNPGDYWVEVGLNGCYALDSIFVTLPLQSIPIP